MEAADSHGRAAGVAALALASSAALVLGVGDVVGFRGASAEALFVTSWLLGWTLMFWAVIFGGVGAVQLGRQLVSRRLGAWSDVALVVAGFAVVVVVSTIHPLWGSGAGAG
jgi:hypothetical protein